MSYRKSVPIILLQDMWNLGKKGEVVLVRPGYMRNCLVDIWAEEMIYSILANLQFMMLP